MMVLMSHPQHGLTHVYDEQELAERKAKGWKIEGDVIRNAEVVIEPPKKRGRPKKVSV